MSSLAILIPSFDKYADIWPVTAHFFRKHWPTCPYPIYLGANGEDRSDAVPEGWRYVNGGPDRSWSRSMADYLAAIPEVRVLVYLDDFIMTAEPDEALVERAMAAMNRTGSPFIQLKPKESCNHSFDVDFVVVPRWNDYRTSLMPTIWDKNLLLKLLRYDFNPWQFERRAGLTRESRLSLFLAVKRDAIPFHHCVQKGMILPWVDAYLEAEGYPLPAAPGRARMGWEEAEASRNRLQARRRILLRLPLLLHALKALRAALDKPRKRW